MSMSENQEKPEDSTAMDEMSHAERGALQAKSWQAILDEATKPDLKALYEQPPSPLFAHYFSQRFGTLTIYDAFNLEPAAPKVPLQLEGASEHYHVFDRGSSLIMGPKNLFSHQRTLKDGIQTAQALATEVFIRGWTMELVGIHSFCLAAYVMLRLLGDQYGRAPEIINYNATLREMSLYQSIAMSRVTPGAGLK